MFLRFKLLDLQKHVLLYVKLMRQAGDKSTLLSLATVFSKSPYAGPYERERAVEPLVPHPFPTYPKLFLIKPLKKFLQHEFHIFLALTLENFFC